MLTLTHKHTTLHTLLHLRTFTFTHPHICTITLYIVAVVQLDTRRCTRAHDRIFKHHCIGHLSAHTDLSDRYTHACMHAVRTILNYVLSACWLHWSRLRVFAACGQRPGGGGERPPESRDAGSSRTWDPIFDTETGCCLDDAVCRVRGNREVPMDKHHHSDLRKLAREQQFSLSA